MLSEEKIKRIAYLARIYLKETDTKNFQDDLSVILDYFKNIDELNLSDVLPYFLVSHLNNIMRGDILEKCDAETVEEIITQAPLIEEKYFKVYKILE